VIGLLFTGGTISMKLDPATGAAVPALSGEEILAQVPGLDAIADIEVEDFSRLPGIASKPGCRKIDAKRCLLIVEAREV